MRLLLIYFIHEVYITKIMTRMYVGMQDWAYAAGWDTKKNHVCEGAQLSTSSSPPNRAAVFLVETSDMKTPREADMGQDIDVRTCCILLSTVHMLFSVADNICTCMQVGYQPIST